MNKKELTTSRLSKVIVRQTDRHLQTDRPSVAAIAVCSTVFMLLLIPRGIYH